MNRTEQIAEAYRAATLRDAWYGPALGELIEQISPEQAAAAPRPKANSISALLQHLLLWNERIRTTSATNPLPKWDAEKEWAEPEIPWTELVPRWKRSRDLLEERIRAFPDEDLPKLVPGRTYSYEKLLAGSVEHVIYHSGQISMILNMLRRT
jgi:uncharacterized damage-inducible protein DinB